MRKLIMTALLALPLAQHAWADRLPTLEETRLITDLVKKEYFSCKESGLKPFISCDYESLKPLTDLIQKENISLNYYVVVEKGESVVYGSDKSSNAILNNISDSGRFSYWRITGEKYLQDTLEFFEEIFKNKRIDIATDKTIPYFYGQLIDQCATPLVEIFLDNGGDIYFSGDEWIRVINNVHYPYLPKEIRIECLNLAMKLYARSEKIGRNKEISRQEFFGLFYFTGDQANPNDRFIEFRDQLAWQIGEEGGFNSGYRLALLSEEYKKMLNAVVPFKVSPKPKTKYTKDHDNLFYQFYKEPQKFHDDVVEVGSIFKKQKKRRGDIRWEATSPEDKEWMCYFSSADEYIEALLNLGYKKEEIMNVNIMDIYQMDDKKSKGIITAFTYETFYPYCQSLKK